MKPILFYDDLSPPVRSVLMLINALNIDVELIFINLFKREHLTKDFLNINPIHTVPAMKFNNNLILTDSHAILIYLVEKYDNENSNLYSHEIVQRSKILNRLFFNSSLLFRRDSDVMSEIFLKQLTDLTGHDRKIEEAYTFLETFLTEQLYMAGDHLTIADISIVCTLSTLDLIIPVTFDKLPKLHNWYERMKQLPYYNSGNQIGLNKLKDKLKDCSNIKIN